MKKRRQTLQLQARRLFKFLPQETAHMQPPTDPTTTTITITTMSLMQGK